MLTSKRKNKHTALVISTLSWGVFIACGFSAHAAENYKLRQAPLGSFGEILQHLLTNLVSLEQPV